MLVRWPCIWCLELGRVGCHVPLCWAGLDYPYFLKFISVGESFDMLLQFAHLFRMSASILWVILLFRWGFGRFRVRMPFILRICGRWALPFLPFAHRLLGRCLGLRLLLLLKQCGQHLLKGVDRILLISNHIELLPLNSGLVFESLDYFFGISCHICKGYCPQARIQRLGFIESRVLVVHLNFPSQQIVVVTPRSFMYVSQYQYSMQRIKLIWPSW